MSTSALPVRWAFAEEDPQGTGPANAGEWLSEGTRIHVLSESVDPQAFVQETVEDRRSVEDPFEVHRVVKGLRNGEHPMQVYGTGSGVATTTGQQIAVTALMRLLRHCLGGLNRGTSLVANGTHSATTVEFADASGLAVGGHLAMVVNGIGYPRRIVAIADNVVTVDQDFPITPEDNDVFAAMATAYVDSAVLFDSNNGGGSGPHTFSHWGAFGQEGALEIWELHGCKAGLTGIQLPRGELPILELTNMFASFTAPNESPANPAWTDPVEGEAPFAVGPDCSLYLGDYGSTASTPFVDPAEVAIDPGVPVRRIGSNTEQQARMQGTANYASAPADTTVTLNISGFDPDYWDDFDADTFKIFRWAKNAAPGGIFCITMPRCEIKDYPRRGTIETVSSNQLLLRAHRDLASVGASQLARSKICIAVG